VRALPLTQNEAKRLIIADRQLCQRYRDDQEALAIQGYKQYLGIRPKLDPEDERSNLHIPVTYRIIDTLRAREVKAICGTRPYVDSIVKPGPNATPELMLQNEEKAKISAALLDQQLNTNKFVSLVYDYATAKLIFPYTVLGVCWRYQKEKRKQRIQAEYLGIKLPFVVTKEQEDILYDDNELVYIDLCDYWYDPWGGGQDISNHSFGIHREWKTRDDIEQELEYYKSMGNGKVFMPTDDQWKKIAEINIDDNRFQRFSEVELQEPSNEGIELGDRPGSNNRNRRYAVYKHWTRNELKILINDEFVPFIGDNPYWRHKQIPFAMQSFEQLPGEVVGRSGAYFIYYLQKEINTQRNQRIDNVALVVNCMWKRRNGATLEESQLISRPGGIIDVDQMDDLQPIIFNDMTGSSVREDQITIKEAEDTLGSPAAFQGIDSGENNTATEITSRNSNASIRIDVKMLISTAPWERIFSLMDMNNQQLITNKRVIEMFGAEGAARWREIGPLDIIGFERDYTLANARVDPTANKEIRRQQLWNSIVEGKKVGLTLDYEALTVEWLKTMDFPNPTKYKLTPQQIQEQAREAAQQQAAAAQEQQQTKIEQEQANQQRQMQQQQINQQSEMQSKMVDFVMRLVEKLIDTRPELIGQLMGGMNGQLQNSETD
jgi:hypothetical protein